MTEWILFAVIVFLGAIIVLQGIQIGKERRQLTDRLMAGSFGAYKSAERLEQMDRGAKPIQSHSIEELFVELERRGIVPPDQGIPVE